MELRFVGDGNETRVLEILQGSAPSDVKPWPWKRWRGDDGVDDSLKFPNHPRNYIARPTLADAVNTSLILEKPLLLTGNPGTGKSQLAERIAWELGLGPVLRFEAQSLSEAMDLFYRFDVVGHLGAVEVFKANERMSSGAVLKDRQDQSSPVASPLMIDDLAAERFVKLGPLGEAIVRSDPMAQEGLFNAALRPEVAAQSLPRRSVVLIDEIDKASRDFPNDLLNGIDRLEFQIRELRTSLLRASEALKPIVIITSNSERELPAAFLRRCAYIHIEDPTQDELRQIVYRRFFAPTDQEGSSSTDKPEELPKLYKDLLHHFHTFREQQRHSLQYIPGTSELIDWTEALRSQKVDQNAELASCLSQVQRVASAVAKSQDDAFSLRKFLDGLRPATAI